MGKRGAKSLAPALLLVALLDAASVSYLSLFGPYPIAVPLGDASAYRNLYTHVPAAIAVVGIASTAAFILGLAGLRRGDPSLVKYLDRSVAVIIALGAYAWVSGTVWSAESWGSPFTWDVRQVTVLVMVLAYAAYPLIRRSEDPERAVRLAYAYAVSAYSITLISLLAPRLVASLHPAPGTIAVLSEDIRVLVAARVALVAASIILLILFGGSRYAAAVYLASIAVPVYGLLPWIADSPVRVVDAGEDYVVLENGARVPFAWEELFAEPYVEVGGEVRPAILERFVLIEDGSVELVTHYSAPLNAIAYLLAASIVHLALSRAGRDRVG